MESGNKSTEIIQVEIITIGDEILIGQIVDTNSAWMGQKLNEVGIRVAQITSISDSREAILEAVEQAEKRVQIVLITGGLGPTKDDITKVTLLEYFGGEMVFSEAQYKQVEALFKSFGREVTPINRKQAEVPSSCKVLVNDRGTAPGMWFEKDSVIYVSMPGVPYEMKAFMENQVIPELKNRFDLPVITHRTFLTQGIGESMLSDYIESWETQLPKHMKLAYLPSPGMVRLRISAQGNDSKRLDEEIEIQSKGLYALINDHIYGEGEVKMAAVIQQLMLDRNLSLSVAESCTGGNIAHMITEIPGASAYFLGSAVTYSEQLKISVLGVPADTIQKFGVVSEQTASAMAEGAKMTFNSDYSIAVTGVAGPDGGSEELPVGSIWIAVSGPFGTQAKLYRFSTHRERNILMASQSALNMLRRILISN
jgi:nicotinamide-nucleotide amidase